MSLQFPGCDFITDILCVTNKESETVFFAGTHNGSLAAFKINGAELQIIQQTKPDIPSPVNSITNIGELMYALF